MTKNPDRRNGNKSNYHRYRQQKTTKKPKSLSKGQQQQQHTDQQDSSVLLTTGLKITVECQPSLEGNKPAYGSASKGIKGARGKITGSNTVIYDDDSENKKAAYSDNLNNKKVARDVLYMGTKAERGKKSRTQAIAEQDQRTVAIRLATELNQDLINNRDPRTIMRQLMQVTEVGETLLRVIKVPPNTLRLVFNSVADSDQIWLHWDSIRKALGLVKGCYIQPERYMLAAECLDGKLEPKDLPSDVTRWARELDQRIVLAKWAGSGWPMLILYVKTRNDALYFSKANFLVMDGRRFCFRPYNKEAMEVFCSFCSKPAHWESQCPQTRSDKPKCGKCSMAHRTEDCRSQKKVCPNCTGKHYASSDECQHLATRDMRRACREANLNSPQWASTISGPVEDSGDEEMDDLPLSTPTSPSSLSFMDVDMVPEEIGSLGLEHELPYQALSTSKTDSTELDNAPLRADHGDDLCCTSLQRSAVPSSGGRTRSPEPEVLSAQPDPEQRPGLQGPRSRYAPWTETPNFKRQVPTLSAPRQFLQPQLAGSVQSVASVRGSQLQAPSPVQSPAESMSLTRVQKLKLKPLASQLTQLKLPPRVLQVIQQKIKQLEHGEQELQQRIQERGQDLQALVKTIQMLVLEGTSERLIPELQSQSQSHIQALESTHAEQSASEQQLQSLDPVLSTIESRPPPRAHTLATTNPQPEVSESVRPGPLLFESQYQLQIPDSVATTLLASSTPVLSKKRSRSTGNLDRFVQRLSKKARTEAYSPAKDADSIPPSAQEPTQEPHLPLTSEPVTTVPALESNSAPRAELVESSRSLGNSQSAESNGSTENGQSITIENAVKRAVESTGSVTEDRSILEGNSTLGRGDASESSSSSALSSGDALESSPSSAVEGEYDPNSEVTHDSSTTHDIGSAVNLESAVSATADSDKPKNSDTGKPKNSDTGKPKGSSAGKPKGSGAGKPKGSGAGKPKGSGAGKPKGSGEGKPTGKPKGSNPEKLKNPGPGRPKGSKNKPKDVAVDASGVLRSRGGRPGLRSNLQETRPTQSEQTDSPSAFQSLQAPASARSHSSTFRPSQVSEPPLTSIPNDKSSPGISLEWASLFHKARSTTGAEMTPVTDKST